MDPSWSNDGKKIVFSHPNINKIHWTEWINTLSGETGKTKEGHLWDVYLVNSDGKNRRNISRDLYQGSSPSWSPDNERILFSSAPEFNNEYLDYNHIFVYDLKRKKIIKISEADMSKSVDTAGFEWSPTENKLAFVSNQDGIYSLYITYFEDEEYNTIKIKENVSYFYWSPDSNKICFYKVNTFPDEQIFTIIDLRNLSEFDFKVCNLNVNWSPDGKYIIYYKLNQDETLTLCLLNVEIFEEINLFNCGNLARDNMIAKFSPNMEKICFNVKKNNNNFIYVMNFIDKGTKEYNDFNGNFFWSPDSSKILCDDNTFILDLNKNLKHFLLVGLESSSHKKILPGAKWSPNSQEICFSTYTDKLKEQIFIFKIEGKKIIQLTNDKKLPCSYPEWSPDGEKILFQRGRLSHNNEYDYFDYYTINCDGTDLKNISNLSIFE